MPEFQPLPIPLEKQRPYRPFTWQGNLCVISEIAEGTITINRVMQSGKLGQNRFLPVSEYREEDFTTCPGKYYIKINKFDGTGVGTNNPKFI